jgi:hypothetical protein
MRYGNVRASLERRGRPIAARHPHRKPRSCARPNSRHAQQSGVFATQSFRLEDWTVA